MAVSTWRSLLCAIVAACSGGHATAPRPTHASPRPGWGARVALAIDVHASQPLVDFPVPIRITPDRIDLRRVATDGHDLRFSDAAGVDLPFEIESLTPSHGAVIWVRIAELSGPTRLTMYFDNPHAPYLDGSESRAVWRAGFAGVFHCVEDGVDSSPAGEATGVVGTNPAQGVFGDAFYFATKKVDALTATIAPLAGDRTLCAWVRPDGVDGSARIAGANGFALERDRAGLRCNTALAPNALAIDAWRFACCVHHAGIDMVFVDGIATGRPGHSSDSVPATAFEVGGRHEDPPAKRFAGTIDEVRMSRVARTPAWLAAEAATKGELVTFGAVENL
jgi:biopolymer transport protein ExbB